MNNLMEVNKIMKMKDVEFMAMHTDSFGHWANE